MEADGLPEPNALGDDNNGMSDDEDGVILPVLTPSTNTATTANLDIDLQNADVAANYLDAWIDFNQDGDWEDSGEQVFTSYDLGTSNGTQTLSFTVPQDTGDHIYGTTYTRFRLSTTGGLSPTGPADDGEVEDYPVALTWFGPPAALDTNAVSDSEQDSDPDLATDGLGNWVAVWASLDNAHQTLDIVVSRSVDDGTTWTAPARVAGSEPVWNNDPQVATDGAGNWVVVWDSQESLGGAIGNGNDILVSRSTDAGITWTDPAPLNTNAGSDSGDDRYAQVMTDGAGNWVAVWECRDSLGGTIGTDLDILVSRSTDAGASWTTAAPLNTNAGSDSGNDYYPQVTTDWAGNWVAVWYSVDSLGGTIGTDTDILLSRSADAGSTWTAPTPLNTNAGSDSGDDGYYSPSQITTDGAGNWIAVWISEDSLGGTIGTDWDILFATFSEILWDYGDAPAPYPTLLADVGARHLATGPTLGTNRDVEPDGQPDPNALGDDNNGTPDDEDGLVNPAVDLSLVEGVVPSVRVNVTNNSGSTATLYGWIDYNGNGVFEASERDSAIVATGSTDLTVTLNNFLAVPAGSVASTYARFRLSTDVAAALPIGAANDGEVEDYTVSIDEAPRVTNVWVSSGSWTQSFLDELAALGVGDATYGYAIPVGSADQLKTLPWFNIDEVAIQFSGDVIVVEGNLGLMGVEVTQYGYASPGFSYDNVTYVATWTLDQQIDQPDKLLIDLSGVTDTASNALDGEWTNEVSTYPSGDGAPGGDFQFRFNVLPGDADQSGWVTGPDWGRIRQQLGTLPGQPGYSILYDVDGSGWITGPDWGRTRARLGDQLPTGEPSPLSSALAELAGDSYASDVALALVLDRQADRVGRWNNGSGRSIWNEALFLVAQDLEHHSKGQKEELPGTLLPAYLDFTLLE